MVGTEFYEMELDIWPQHLNRYFTKNVKLLTFYMRQSPLYLLVQLSIAVVSQTKSARLLVTSDGMILP
jgi:hypothetical protein